MAAFSGYMDILPDPDNKIGAAGESLPTGTAGPGYASVKLTSDQKIITSRTNSNRLSARTIAGHKWNIDIGYNPMTQEQFLPIYNFLLQRIGPLNPFYISLPQYKTPQNSTFSTALQDSTNPLYMYPTTAEAAGATSMLIRGRRSGITGSIPNIDTILATRTFSAATTYTNVASTSSGSGTGATFNITTTQTAAHAPTIAIYNPGSGYVDNEDITISSSLIGASGNLTFKVNGAGTTGSSPYYYYTYNYLGQGSPTPGDLFTVSDTGASNHTKAYMVTRVETTTDYKSTEARPTENQVRIHFTPGLSKNINAKDAGTDYKLNFYNPLVRVVLPKALHQYSLDVNNLYKYSLKVEEAES
jgi:hypothetical protein